MIIKNLWEGVVADIKWRKNHKDLYAPNEMLAELFIGCIVMVLFTPIIAITDLLLAPFEIGYYFFKKWINKD